MPYTRSTIQKQADRQLTQESPIVWLYEFESKDESGDFERFRVCNARAPITFGSGDTANVFQRWPIVHGGIETSGTGERTTVKVTAALDREFKIRDALERNNGLLGREAIIHVVRLSEAGSPSSAITFPFKVQGCAPSTEGGVVFTLSTENFFKRKLPKWRYSRGSCFRAFGDEGCGYVKIAGATNAIGGGFDFCRRNPDDCSIRGLDEAARSLANNHPARLGAFPGMLSEPVG